MPLSLHCIQENTHTHKQTRICGLRGLSIGVMVFILFKLYVLLPYTNHTPKLSPHRKLWFSKKKHLVCFIKPFELRGHSQCPHKPPSNCNTYVIIHLCVIINHIYQFTLTHTHKHTRTLTHTHTHTHSVFVHCKSGWSGLIFLFVSMGLLLWGLTGCYCLVLCIAVWHLQIWTFETFCFSLFLLNKLYHVFTTV